MFYWRYTCPLCRQKYKTPAWYVRRQVECHCGLKFRIPAAARLELKADQDARVYDVVRFVSKN